MDLNQLFSNKEIWQKNTFDRIKSSLISARNNRFVNYDSSKEKHLVIIYGKSQVGKTTLILNMIGIKDEFIQEVYELLRAGVPRGNSSTSTSIIYSKSDNEKYGCSITSINDLLSKNVTYYDKHEMIQRLKEIRYDVENNRINSENILFIYIPNYYFIEDSNVNNISIMDMPGVESRNHKEDIHVHNLMTKYIPIASVCIIACRCNDIQSLESTVLPNEINWQNMSHKFILVITNSYNDGSIKKYFKIRKSERAKPFYDYVKETYTGEIRKILGEKNETEVYPVDIGDTFKRLYSEELKDEADKNEIVSVRNKILSDLRKSIIMRKGEKLKSALMDLEAIANSYREDEIQELTEKISSYEEKIEYKRDEIKKSKKNIEELTDSDSEKVELEDEIRHLRNISYQLKGCMDDCIEDLYSYVERKFYSKDLYKDSKKGTYLNDKEENLLSYIRDYISQQVYVFFNEISGLLSDADASVDVISSQIIYDIDSSCIAICQDKLYPSKKSLFAKKEKVYLEDIEAVCKELRQFVNKELDLIRNKYVSLVNEIISKNQQEVYRIDRIVLSQNDKINRFEYDILTLKNDLKYLKERKFNIIDKKQQDKETLEMYLKFAYEAYIEQRVYIVDLINSSTTPDNKVFLILLLGLLDKDYIKVTGGINEKHNK